MNCLELLAGVLVHNQLVKSGAEVVRPPVVVPDKSPVQEYLDARGLTATPTADVYMRPEVRAWFNSQNKLKQPVSATAAQPAVPAVKVHTSAPKKSYKWISEPNIEND